MPTVKDKVISLRVPDETLLLIKRYAKVRKRLLAHAVLELIDRGLWTIPSARKAKGAA